MKGVRVGAWGWRAPRQASRCCHWRAQKPLLRHVLCPQSPCSTSLPVSFLFHFHSFFPSSFYVDEGLRVAREMCWAWSSLGEEPLDTPVHGLEHFQLERQTEPAPEAVGSVRLMAASPHASAPAHPSLTGTCLLPSLLTPTSPNFSCGLGEVCSGGENADQRDHATVTFHWRRNCKLPSSSCPLPQPRGKEAWGGG